VALTMRAVIILAIMLVHRTIPVDAETLTCSTFQGIHTCQDAHGYVSHETEWQGRTNGWDNRGDTWSTSRWRDNETTTITPMER
jgi:hypothetical protein